MSTLLISSGRYKVTHIDKGVNNHASYPRNWSANRCYLSLAFVVLAVCCSACNTKQSESSGTSPTPTPTPTPTDTPDKTRPERKITVTSATETHFPSPATNMRTPGKLQLGYPQPWNKNKPKYPKSRISEIVINNGPAQSICGVADKLCEVHLISDTWGEVKLWEKRRKKSGFDTLVSFDDDEFEPKDEEGIEYEHYGKIQSIEIKGQPNGKEPKPSCPQPCTVEVRWVRQ